MGLFYLLGSGLRDPTESDPRKRNLNSVPNKHVNPVYFGTDSTMHSGLDTAPPYKDPGSNYLN